MTIETAVSKEFLNYHLLIKMINQIQGMNLLWSNKMKSQNIGDKQLI